MKKMVMVCLIMAICGLGLATKMYAPTRKPPVYLTGDTATRKKPDQTQATLNYFKSQGGIDEASRKVLSERIEQGLPGISEETRASLRKQLADLPNA